ncbi:MAG: SwmB domain-containing protein [Methylococcales bacterium]|nr:SwmB domain-containing protein [Methylococcales bacterium]
MAGNNYVATKAPLSFFTKDSIKPTSPEQPKPPVIDEKPVTPSDDASPVLTAAKVNGAALILSFDDANLLSTTTANPAAFNVLSNGAANPVTDIFVNPTAKTVALILTNSVLNGDNVTVSPTRAQIMMQTHCKI